MPTFLFFIVLALFIKFSHETNNNWIKSYKYNLEVQRLRSETVDVIILSFIGIFVVYRTNRVGPSSLPCGTPASMLNCLDVVALHLTAKTLWYDSTNFWVFSDSNVKT